MEPKINYQYTYFIHPFVVKEQKYPKYLIRLLKDKNIKLKIFKKEKDLNLYKYFLPEVRKILFSSFDYSASKIKSLQTMPVETASAILSKNPCTIFEYNLPADIQGKEGFEKGIFFKISKIDIICFNTGICFLCMKTNIENTNNFADLLNFNYKFRDINQEFKTKQYDRIRVQSNSFGEVQEISHFIKELTGTNMDAPRYDIETERFYTYSYVCIDQDYWNEYRKFENIEHNFTKFANFMPAENIGTFIKDETVQISEWKYAKIALNKQGVTLFSSSVEMNNYTIFPEEFENQYLYTYILNLYKKLYLKKLSVEFSNSKSIKTIRKKFVDFTKNIWIQEITQNEAGSIINHRLNDVLELESLYSNIKNKYDVLYKDLNIEKNHTITIVLAVLLFVTILLNIVNYIQLLK